MRIAVLSDIHDNIWNLSRAMEIVADTGSEQLAFLGDFCAPFTLKQLAESFSAPIHAVFGNNDGDPWLLTSIAAGFAHVTLHGQFGTFDAGGKTVAINHYPEIAEPVAASERFDAVFSGHDHQRYEKRYGRTLWANPGEIMGRFGRPGFGLYDTDTDTFTHYDVR